MSTAARPTYFAAIGRSTYGGVASRQTSGKDQIAHTKLKYRVVGQASVSEMKEKNLKVDFNFWPCYNVIIMTINVCDILSPLI